MVRWPAPPPPPDSAQGFGHDAIALSFFVVCVAATVALASSMCSACGRKPKAAATEPDAAASDQPAAGAGSVSVSVSGGRGKQEAGAEAEEEVVEVVRLSPELATHGAIDPVALPSTTSKRRLSISMSKNLSMNIPDKLRLSRRERKDPHHKVESEDTLWKKGIILGEKCRIPGEREAELGDGGVDPVDELAAGSFRRSSYSRPVSRSNSFAMHNQQPPQPQQDARVSDS